MNINLCELLKGHEGEIFYSPVFGDVVLEDVNCQNVPAYPIMTKEEMGMIVYFSKEGKFSIISNSECVLFPSKDQRDWEKWVEEQKSKNLKTPKTWSEIADNSINITEKNADIIHKCNKSTLALMKIYQLIEVGYCGIPTKEERFSSNGVYIPRYKDKDTWIVVKSYNHIEPIAFRGRIQCANFLSYPENIQLLKDFYML